MKLITKFFLVGECPTLRARSHELFSPKISMIYVSKGTNYASLAVSFSCIVKKLTWHRSRGSQMVFTLGALKNLTNFAGKIHGVGASF